MHRLPLLLIVLAVVSAPACEADDAALLRAEPSLASCLAPRMERLNMVPYVEGDEVGGKFFLEAYSYSGRTYLSLSNFLADIPMNLTSCDDGVEVCGRRDDETCQRVWFDGEYLGIVAVDR